MKLLFMLFTITLSLEIYITMSTIIKYTQPVLMKIFHMNLKILKCQYIVFHALQGIFSAADLPINSNSNVNNKLK